MAVVMLVANGMHLVVLYDKNYENSNTHEHRTSISTHQCFGFAALL